jgi:hypothetical protein
MDKKEENLHLLRRYIKETIDLGKVQFAPDRLDIEDDELSDTYGDKKPREKNTPEEQSIYNDLGVRLRVGGSIPTSTAKKLSSLINSKYGVGGSGFFRGPLSNSVLYRGDAFDEDWFNTHVGVSLDSIESQFIDVVGPTRRYIKLELEKQNKESRIYNFKTPYLFDDLRGWTPDFEVAAGFAGTYGVGDPAVDPKKFAVVLHVYPGDNDPDALLDFSAGIYKTNAGIEYATEREVMNLKPVICRAANIVMIKKEAEEKLEELRLRKFWRDKKR